MTLPAGNHDAHEAFLAAMSSGSLHHAWLFTGPMGVGKASFARAAALRLLAEAARPGVLAPGFDVPDDDRTRALIAAGSHPDYRELMRMPKDADKPGQDLARSIPIAQVRALQPLFATTPSMSPRRVVLIDSVDDLERPGASNALLKNLEEPPAGTIFLLISHSPGRLLPTIRSRCRRLRFDPLSDDELAGVLRAALPEANAGEIAALVRAGDGSPGRALGYAGLDMAALDGVMTAIATSGDHSNAQRTKLAKSLSLKAAQPRYEAFLDRVPSFIAEASTARQGDALKAALDAYDGARALAISARALSLDQQATVYEMAGLVARLAAS
ncbi:AAA family ATPase [Sphingomonas sp. 28-63-12]|uniref:AAA family ATPase n=1 Tax=Sphingomonas sp. 28-63-12 TaxID=1970434 RepID=UPI000BCBA462|nr:MAG: DNA polymerase III subunit delta' [Sphingomonas sp. 28-63-12]